MSVPGRRRVSAMPAPPRAEVGAFRARHLALAQRTVQSESGRASVTVDDGESPLAWLARRRGRDGRALIAPHQLQAGERLRADFTVAHLMPRVTANWSSPIASGRRGGESAAHATDTMVAARQRVHAALDAAGPEFAGLLLDICCFLKGLEGIEREREWPARAARSCCCSRSTASPATTAMRPRRAADSARRCARGWRTMRNLAWSVFDCLCRPGRARQREARDPYSAVYR
jgi:hypothetical protein